MTKSARARYTLEFKQEAVRLVEGGQSAPVVVLCEIDFETLSDRDRRKLFVGMSRAQLRLECVVSERTERALAKLLQPSNFPSLQLSFF